MYIGGTIRPHEELRAGMLDAANVCECGAKSETECDNCQAELCGECAVKCAGCDSDNEYCVACATRCGYVEHHGKHSCENCAGEFEQ